MFFAVFFISNIGLSDETIRFRTAALNFIDKAEANGHSEIEGISLQEIRRAAQEILILHNPNVTVGVGNRRRAMWQAARERVRAIGSNATFNVPPQIFVNKRCANLSNTDLGIIATHEFIGAKFNRDLNYDITTRMALPVSNNNSNQIRWKMNRDQQSRTGGSTCVGGGGDEDDLKFKLAGLKTLQNLAQSRSTVFGIPVEMLRETIHQMQIGPASDIDTFMVFRKGIQGSDQAKIFVQSYFYRGTDLDLGLWALYAARLLVIYSPYELGLVDRLEDENAFTKQQLLNLKNEILLKDSLSVEAYWFETNMIRKK